MEEFLCLKVLSNPAESANAFSQRLSVFWTHMLREHPEEFKQVYAEGTKFECEDGLLSRQYAVVPGIVQNLCTKICQAGLKHSDLLPDDLYTVYEIIGPDWMQIEH